MKKTILPIVLLALCLGACNNNEGNEGNEDDTLQNTFNNFIIKYQQPKLNFDLGMYKLYDDDAKGWPFADSKDVLRIGQWRAESNSVRYLNYSKADVFLVSVIPGEHYSYIAYNPVLETITLDNTQLLGNSPYFPARTINNNQPDDIWFTYIKDYEAPTGKKDYEKIEDPKLGKISIDTDTLTLVPATKPYQIEICDPSGQMTAVEGIYITGFANGMDLISGQPTNESDEIYFEMAMPVQAVSTLADNGQRTFIGNVGAIKLRTWGRAGKSNIEMDFIAVANEKDYHFKVPLTDLVRAYPNGGIISIGLPNGVFN